MTGFAVLADDHLGRTSAIVNLWNHALPHSDREVFGAALESRLRNFVERINVSPEINFVVSVGDITESICQEQVELLQNILGELEVPFLPFPGNHDIWSYQRNGNGKVLWKAEEPLNFSSFKKLFSRDFTTVSRFFQNWKEQGDRFSNFSFSYDGVKFIAVDNVNRRAAPFRLPGVISRSKVHPESERWLQEELRTAEEKRIVIISHAPLKTPFPRGVKMGKEILALSGHAHQSQLKNNGGVTFLHVNALYVEPVFPVINMPSGGNFEVKKVYLDR